ncbi:MAG: serine/threonine-protein kinase [Phycisphaerae bacterium]|jgi:tRNA A-37 threonylcarbamoyl transferase component Bud32|nr:serine/threonine-protein kinase [Phycisphaerae bacterium]
MINSNESNVAEGIGFKPGEEIGRYEVISRIAIGGQSIIYKCHDPALDRLVAIKQISSHLAEDKMFLDRFRSEAQILARLGAEQPEVVTIHDLLENRQGLFIVMEFIEGISLEKTLSGNPDPVELKATLQILWRLCSALHTVHVAGVIHRDIKPSNIIIADGLRPMITDFGVAATSSGEASMVMGTTKYMAPELFTGGYVDGRADMYSLGFIAYEMLVGREKFNEIFADIVRDRTAEKVRWMKWHSNPKVSAPPPHEVNPAVPVTLSNIVLRMIAKDSEQRFEGMEDLGRAIKLTFRPGAKVAGAPVPVAPPVGDDALPLASERTADGTPFDTEDAVTAPIPKRKLSLRVKVSMAVAALLLIVGGLVIQARMRGQDTNLIEKSASKAYATACKVYESAEDYAEAEKQFLALRQKYGQTRFAEPSEVYIHMSRAHLAVQTGDWSRAQTEQDTADDLTRKIQKKSAADSKPFKWSVKMKDSIKAFETLRMDKKAFAETMSVAQQLFDAGKYDEAVAALDDKYEDPGRLENDQQQILLAFKEKVVRTESLGECETLLAAARKADTNDPGAALAAYDKASSGLQRLKQYVDPIKWNTMNSEVKGAREKLMKAQGLNDIMAAVDNARQSGDTDRLRRALETAMTKPGVPPQLIKGWVAEIKKIQEDADLAAITKLVVNDQIVEALDALDIFIKKYPSNKRAPLIKEGLEKKRALAALKKNAADMFDRGRWAEALPLLKKLRAIDRGDRKIKEMIRDCGYQLELEVFNAAVAAGDYPKAVASGRRAGDIWPDGYDRDIEPKLVAMQAKQKVIDTLAKGAAALKGGQYSEVRKTLAHLKDSYPEAAEMIRKSKYLENLDRGNTYRADGNIKTAWATYKTAKSYAKTPQEHKEIDALISATAAGGS